MSRVRATAVAVMSMVWACGTGTGVAENPLEGTAWILESLTADGSVREAIPEARVTASFINGELSGDTGCNRYSLAYSVDGAELRLGALLLTGAACDSPAIVDQENAFVAGLERIEAFSVSPESLELHDADRYVLMVFVRAEAARKFRRSNSS